MISRETYDAWRAPRFGSDNPTRLDNELWALLVHDRINAYQVDKRYGYEGYQGRGPTWCFDRFGRSETPLADGRVIHIAGEHEDYYDPDFYIYNDVIVVAPDGAVAIYGYPRDVFPPTDFHSATLVGDRIWIVGSLGYMKERQVGVTQVCVLDLPTMAIEKLATTGEPPGWIHKHTAELADGAIVVRGGIVETPKALEENIDEWALDLATRVWTRRTARDWQRWSAVRADGKRSVVWELRQLAFDLAHPQYKPSETMRKMVVDALGTVPDLAPLATLYGDGARQDDDRHDVWRIEIDGVTVRFTEHQHSVDAMVEGRISEPRLAALQQHVLAHLTALHGTEWILR